MSKSRNSFSTESMNGDYVGNAETALSSGGRAQGFEKMKALAEGGILLREGQFIKLEDRTNQKRNMI